MKKGICHNFFLLEIGPIQRETSPVTTLIPSHLQKCLIKHQ